MKRLLVLLMIFSVGITASCQQWLSTNYPRPILEKIIPAPTSYAPIPPAKDLFWKNTIPLAVRNDYIRWGEKFIGQEWQKIPDDIFAEYKTSGNRRNYENKSFELRCQLAYLVMAEIMEQKGRFMKDIIQGLHYMISEIWWGIPAHYPLAQPESDTQVVDLFNAETANLLAWTIYMLHDDLETEQKGICKIVRKEIDRRMMTPARTIDYSWKKKTNNWNPWICANWLSCVLFCETDRQHQIDAIQQILKCLDVFVDGYPNDGGCDEGIGYWNRATGSLFDCIQLLSLATNNAVSYPQTEKFLAMATFPYKLYIGNNQYVNFADTRPNATIPYEVAFPLGLSIGDSILTQFAALIAQRASFNTKPAHSFQTSEFPSLSRELLFLIHYHTFKDTKSAEPLVRDIWLPDLQVFTARSEELTTHHLYVAAKGGHNDENHNHNDVGNFIVYDNAKPVIIDIGVGTYTAQTFSKQRYELFNCRSAYHNVPLINGMEQQQGAAYHAKDVTCSYNDKRATFSLDIAQAYPNAAAVNKWERTVILNRGENVTVTENYELKKYLRPSQIILVCCEEARETEAGVIAIGDNHQIQFDDKQLHASIEKMVYDDTIIRKAWKNKNLYRIILTIQSRIPKGSVSYTIQ